MTEQENLLQYEAFLQSPPILKGGGYDGFPLFQLSISPAQGSNTLPEVPDNLVFGKRIESFFSYSIKNSEDYTLLAENLQVIKDKVTLGELDFLLKDKHTGEVLHVELAFKFYLYKEEEGPDELSRWIGPNHRDRLSLKLQKLKERQFPLLYHPETQKILRSLGIKASKVQQQLCIQGLLFLPLSWKGKPPPKVNPAAIKGWWIHAAEFSEENFGTAKFAIPEKQEWVIDPKFSQEWISFSEAREFIHQKITAKKSLMCWMRRADGGYERFFVVWW